jgi:DNA-binding NtrC family response regulator
MTSEAAVKQDSEGPPPVPGGDPRDEQDSLFDQTLVREATLLVVDDEQLVTNSLRHFFQIEMNIENVVAFNVSSEAAKWAEENRVDLVITDFLMPGMDGLALLTTVRRVHPEATRILLTGYADKANAIRAINEVGLFQYIEKPWDTDRLATVVRAGLEHMALQRTLRQLIDKLNLEQSAREHMRRALLRAFA